MSDELLAGLLRRFLTGETYASAWEETDYSQDPPAPYRVVCVDGAISVSAEELAAVQEVIDDGSQEAS